MLILSLHFNSQNKNIINSYKWPKDLAKYKDLLIKNIFLTFLICMYVLNLLLKILF